jgi:FkbM family methyltransferase
MITFRELLRHSLPAHLWRRARLRYFQRHIVPKQTETELEGVRLDLSDLSPRMREVVLSGNYERSEVTLCRQMLEPGDRILELGGAIGYVGLFCLKNLQAAEVVSAEPNPRTAAILRRNYALNNLKPNVEEVAISDHDGILNLSTSDDFWGDNAFVANGTSAPSQLKVATLTIRSLLQKQPSNFTVLISDVEGAESLIQWNDIPQCITKIIIELHPGIVGYTHAYHALNSIMNLGFSVESRMNDVLALRRTPKVRPPSHTFTPKELCTTGNGDHA